MTRFLTYILFFVLEGILLPVTAQIEKEHHPYTAPASHQQESFQLQIEELKRRSDSIDRYREEINSTQVEELHKRYSVDELKLENQQSNQLLIKRAVAVVAALVTIALLATLLLVRRRRKVYRYQEQLTQAIATYQSKIGNTNLFLANMSHEIRTPLNALSGFSDLLATPGVDDSTQQACREMIEQNSDLLMKLMNDVIAYSCTKPQEMIFAYESTEVVQLCQRVVATLNQVKTTCAVIKFETDQPQLMLHTDPIRLQQLLINLLMNANKFTKQGSIVLKLEWVNEQWVHFTVTDTGRGIPLSDQSRLFNRYEKLREQEQGTGLGLAICKAIANRLGGDIWIDSTYTQGARFVTKHPYAL
ncbi:MAG: sensor histidine kinase [Phocaeicola sp.]